MQKIYFQKTPLIIATSEKSISKEALQLASWDKEVIKGTMEGLNASDHNEVVIIHPDIEMVLEAIKTQYNVIQAAGGLVFTKENELLLIFRRGKWDLPKGKLDEGETLEECAVREVEEEAGLKGIQLQGFLQATYHTYIENEQDILKESHWYLMEAEKQTLQPQTEEDIEDCKWVSIKEVAIYYENMQPSVRDVIEAYLNKKNN